MKICKFGGTSMANADTIKLVKDIIQSDEARRFVVVSAPGKRDAQDIKVTDLLYEIVRLRDSGDSLDSAFSALEKRFTDITDCLDIQLDIKSEIAQIRANIERGYDAHYAASRGEYLSALVTAKYLGFEFVDAAEIIKFYDDGRFNPEYTADAIKARLCGCKNAVVPGFYGKCPSGAIKTFSRGGSDVSGALLAQSLNARVYENWTDVDGFMACDPRIVPNAAHIEQLTYRELRELSYMGANVLHPESIFPVSRAGIPINIKNTFNPAHKGTMIVSLGDYKPTSNTVTGIAGKKGFMSITVEKAMMNNELGFARKILTILEHYNISFEHMPSGVDTLTVIIEKSFLGNNLDAVLKKIDKACDPDRVFIEDNISLIAVVGHGMRNKKGTSGRIFTALSRADVNIKLIDQGSCELNIILGVENSDYEKAIKAIYLEMVEND